MVDFNNETTITRPAIDIERVIVLQRRFDCIEAYESYNKHNFQGAGADISDFKARLNSLFWELKSALKRHFPKNSKGDPSYKDVDEWIKSDNDEDLLKAFDLINDWLDSIKLTRLDTHKVYDSTRVETENREKKL